MVFPALSLLIDPEPRGAAWNMAADEVLAQRTSVPILRAYRWKTPSVSFGYFGVFHEITARWPDREPVRRWTGGGEVPHGDDFTYSLAIPRSEAFAQLSVRESYEAIHQALVPCLPGAYLASSDAAQNPSCFARPVVADVLVDACKVAGAAQRRGRFGLLHQGSVQGTALPHGLARQFASSLASVVTEVSYDAALLDEIDHLSATRYGTEQWLKRR